MRPGGTITRIFKSFLVESETYTEDFEQIIHEGKQVIYAAEGTHYFKDWEEESKDLDNAFIPVVNIIESNDHQYNIKVVKDRVLTLDACIEEKLRKPEVKEIKLLVNKGNAKLKFNVTKGNPKANDSDGGNITAVFFDGKGKEIIRNELKDKKYGDTFELEIDPTKKIHHIKFYANDNDIFFDGGVSNVYCGEVIFSSCYCDRDFTVEELKNLIITIRKNSFYKDGGKEYPMYNLHKEKLFFDNATKCKYSNEVVQKKDQTFKNLTEVLNLAFSKYEIDTCIKKMHFLSQMFVETQWFTKTIEGDNDYVKKYDPYRGRGFIQISLEENYIKYSNDKKNAIINISGENKSKVATDLEVAADTSCWFWRFGSVINGQYMDINNVAMEKDVSKVTRRINPALKHLKERKEAFAAIMKIIKYENACINKI